MDRDADVEFDLPSAACPAPNPSKHLCVKLVAPIWRGMVLPARRRADKYLTIARRMFSASTAFNSARFLTVFLGMRPDMSSNRRLARNGFPTRHQSAHSLRLEPASNSLMVRSRKSRIVSGETAWLSSALVP